MDLLKRPTTDFRAVRDGRQSMPLWLDVDLTTARSISAGTALVLNIAGNSFYTDADTTNGGNALVHFQDTNLGKASAPFFVSPGFIANVGFTQLLIENTAQAGKRMRIFYGVDIDFQAGVNASISIGGRVDVNDVVNAGCQVIVPALTGALGTNINQLLAPAVNLNGCIVRELQMSVAPSTAAGNAYVEGRPGIVRNPRKNRLADCFKTKNYFADAKAGFHRPALVN